MSGSLKIIEGKLWQAQALDSTGFQGNRCAAHRSYPISRFNSSGRCCCKTDARHIGMNNVHANPCFGRIGPGDHAPTPCWDKNYGRIHVLLLGPVLVLYFNILPIAFWLPEIKKRRAGDRAYSACVAHCPSFLQTPGVAAAHCQEWFVISPEKVKVGMGSCEINNSVLAAFI